MATVSFRLGEDFLPRDLAQWHQDSRRGDIAIIALPDRPCKVRLITRPNNYVSWWPEGASGITVTLEEATARLAMLAPK